jgi:hypothetical protein
MIIDSSFYNNCIGYRAAAHSWTAFVLAMLSAFAAIGYATTSYAAPAFQDVSAAAGFSGSDSETFGASWGDINGDYFPDIFVSNHRTRSALYRNNTNGTFADVSGEVDLSRSAGWTGGRQGVDHHGAAWGDFDNDGDDDLFLTVSSEDDQFLVNQNGLLTDRSIQWEVNQFSTTAKRMPLFLDYTGDGLLDMFIAGLNKPYLHPQQTDGTFGVGSSSRKLLDCNDDATFGHMADVNTAAGLELLCAPRNGVYPENIYSFVSGIVTDVTSGFPQTSKVNDAVTADFNGDLRPDVFEIIASSRPSGAIQVNEYRIESQLLTSAGNVKTVSFKTTGNLALKADIRPGEEATGDPRYIDIGSTGYSPTNLEFTLDPNDSRNWGIATSASGMNIGYDQVSQTWQVRQNGTEYNYSFLAVVSDQPITNLVFAGATAADKPAVPKLLMNYPGVFVDETVSRGLGGKVQCVSAVPGDFDNDMDQDLFLACTGGPNNIPNVLYENQGNGNFVAVSNGGGAAGLVGAAYGNNAGTSESVVTADYNLDGFLDLFVTNGNNMRPVGFGGPKQLFKNLGNTNNWLLIDLQGTTSNRDGVGAKVLVTAGGITQYREQNGGYHRWSQNHKRLHLGLANNTVASVSVEWPNGQIDNFADVDANKLYRLTQGGGIEQLTPVGGDQKCGKPTYSKATDKHAFLWKDCAGNGQWHLRATAGGSTTTVSYGGKLTSDLAFGNLAPFSFESNDVLLIANSPPRVDFVMKVSGTAEDGLDFTAPSNGNTCLDVSTLPAGSQLLLGSGRTPVPARINLDTLQSCSSAPPPDVGACGQPTINYVADGAVFIWKDCDADNWHVRASSAQGYVKYVGNISSSEPLQNVTGFSLESTDTLDNSIATQINFGMGMSNPAGDGFNFTAACSAQTTFNLTSPTGANVLVGVNRDPVAANVTLNQLSACAAP